jgi:hypothetical protein
MSSSSTCTELIKWIGSHQTRYPHNIPAGAIPGAIIECWEKIEKAVAGISNIMTGNKIFNAVFFGGPSLETQKRFVNFILDKNLPFKKDIIKKLLERNGDVLEKFPDLRNKIHRIFKGTDVVTLMKAKGWGALSTSKVKGLLFDAALLGLSTLTVYYTQEQLDGESTTAYLARRDVRTLSNIDNYVVNRMASIGATTICTLATKGVGYVPCKAAGELAGEVVASYYSGSKADRRFDNLLSDLSDRIPGLSNWMKKRSVESHIEYNNKLYTKCPRQGQGGKKKPCTTYESKAEYDRIMREQAEERRRNDEEYANTKRNCDGLSPHKKRRGQGSYTSSELSKCLDHNKKITDRENEKNRYENAEYYPPCSGRNGQRRCLSFCNNVVKSVRSGTRCPFPSEKAYNEYKLEQAQKKEADKGIQDCRFKSKEKGRKRVQRTWYDTPSPYDYCINHNKAINDESAALEKAAIEDKLGQDNKELIYVPQTKEVCMKEMKNSPKKLIIACEQFQSQTYPYLPLSVVQTKCPCQVRFTHWCIKGNLAVKKNNLQNYHDCDAETRNYDAVKDENGARCGMGRTYKLKNCLWNQKCEAWKTRCDKMAKVLDDCRARYKCYPKKVCVEQANVCTCPSNCEKFPRL